MNVDALKILIVLNIKDIQYQKKLKIKSEIQIK